MNNQQATSSTSGAEGNRDDREQGRVLRDPRKPMEASSRRATTSKQTKQETSSSRPRSPIQRIPRFRLDDTDVFDNASTGEGMSSNLIPFKEIEFQELCKSMGMTYESSKSSLMFDDNGELLETPQECVSIKLEKDGKYVRFSGGYTESSRAKEKAFIHGLNLLTKIHNSPEVWK